MDLLGGMGLPLPGDDGTLSAAGRNARTITPPPFGVGAEVGVGLRMLAGVQAIGIGHHGVISDRARDLTSSPDGPDDGVPVGSATWEWTTRIELCGQLAVEIEGERIEGSLRGRQGRLLLAYLVLNRHRPVRRDELVDALWLEPEGPSATLLPAAVAPAPLATTGARALRAEPGAAGGRVGRLGGRAGETEARRARAGSRGGEVSAGALEIADRGLLPGLEAVIDVAAPSGRPAPEALEVRAAAGAASGPEQNEADARPAPRPRAILPPR